MLYGQAQVQPKTQPKALNNIDERYTLIAGIMYNIAQNLVESLNI